MTRIPSIATIFIFLAAVVARGQVLQQTADDAASTLSRKLYTVANRLDPPLLEPSQPYAVQRSLYEKNPREGFLQQLYHSTTRITADSNDLSITELDFSATIGFPFPERETPLLLTPAFGLDVLRSDALDVPSELYDATFEIRTLRQFGECWTVDLAVMPGVYGNTDTDENQFRVQGRAVGIYQWSPYTKALLGVAYLDRDDVSALPVIGMIWTPTDYWKLDLLFPRPRIACRTHQDCCSAWWAYLSGEFGGGSWGMNRVGGAADVVTLRDWRLMLGIERQSDFISVRFEGGYVFSREIEYASGVGDTELDGAGLVRAVVSY